jgi:hypothetical protein
MSSRQGDGIWNTKKSVGKDAFSRRFFILFPWGLFLFAFARIPCGLSKIPDFERDRRDDPSSLKASAFA